MQQFYTKILQLLCTFTVFGLVFSPTLAAVKDQSRIVPQINGKTPPKPADPLLPEGLDPQAPGQLPGEGNDNMTGEEGETLPNDPYDINDIPALVRLKLTIDIAKRALDAFADVGTKYDDKGLYDYPTLEEFVEKTESGKQLQSDVQKHGFKDIVEWNTAIMNVSFAFGALLQDQEKDIRQQIAAVKEDKTLAPDKKQRIIASLNALIPTKENIQIIKDLKKLPAYQEKLNLLDAFE